jgi:hypothetical protein
MSEPTNDMNKTILEKLLAQEIELIELRRIRSEQSQALDRMRFNVLEDPVLRQAFAAAGRKDYDAMKADLERLQARLDHMEATWPRDPHHGGKIYDMPVDPLMREAIDSAKLARKEGGAS